MWVIVMLSQKGGSGKTSLTISLASAAEEAGQSALIIDLDPQATVCKWGDRRSAETPIVLDAQPARLAKALEKAKEGGVDVAVIDTPPRSAEAALAAAKLADLIVLPCRPQMYDLETIPNTLELIATARSGRGPVPTLAVLSAVPPQGSRQDQARKAVEAMGVSVCPHTIGNRAAFGDAGALGLSVVKHEPKGRAAEEVRQVYHAIRLLLTSAPSTETAKPGRSKRTAR
jgi:chromosome partitioning protein